MNTPILSDIFQRALSLELNVQRENAKQQKTAYALWAEMAESLEVIAANSIRGIGTDGRTVTNKASGKNSVTGTSDRHTEGASHAGASASTKNKRSSGGNSASGKSSSGTAGSHSVSKGKGDKAKTAGINREAGPDIRKKKDGHDKGVRAGRQAVTKKEDKQPKAIHRTISTTAESGSKKTPLADAIKQAGNKQASSISNTLANQEEQSRKKTKSAEALQSVQQQKREDKRQNGFFSRLKDAYENTKQGHGTGDVIDAAGMAAGGPVWAVAKELKQAGSSLVGEDSFLGRLRANFKKAGEQEPGKTGKTVEAKEGGPMRDEHGRFIKASETGRTRREKEELELATESLDLDTKEAVRTQRRHKELVRAVRSLKPSFLGEALKGLLGRRGPSVSLGRGRKQKVRPDIDVHKDRDKDKKRRGHGGDISVDASRDDRKSRRLGGGSDIGRGRPLGSAGEKFGDAVPAKRGAEKGAGKLGGRMALLNAGKLIPGIGLAIGAIAAVVDAVDGWNDTDLHKRAFGLKDGQEATTGQKAASAAANILDLGGLTTGIANLLGFDIDTADIARGVYNTVSAVSNFFKQFSLDGALSAVKGVLDSGLTLASDAISGITDFVGSLNLGERIQGLVSTVAEYGGKAVDFVVGAFSAIPEMLSGINFGEKIQGVVTAVSDTVSNVFSTISDFISSLDIKGIITGAIDAVADVGGKIADTGKGLFTSAKNWLLGDDKKEEKPAIPASEAVPTAKPKLSEKAPPVAEAPKDTASSAKTALAVTPSTSAASANSGDVKPVSAELPASVPSFGEPAKTPAPQTAAQAPLVPAMSASDKANMAQAVSASMPEIGDLADKTGQLVKISEEELKLREKEFNLRLADPNSQAVAAQQAGGPNGMLIPAGGGSSLGGGMGGGGGSIDFSGAVATGGFSSTGKIGDTVARFESGNAGVSDVSWDRTGGSSYGKWQLSAKQGSMGEYLRWMQQKGGKEAEIANSIIAAGPLENGKNGAAATEYKRQAAANGQLMEETQRQFILEKQVNPALKKLPPELQQRINNSGAMQEMFWSTVVQHGQGGGASIFRNIFNQNRNASDEDLIKAIYADRGNHFQSSSAETQASVRRRFKEEVGVILGMYQNEKKGGTTSSGANVLMPAAGGMGGGAIGGAVGGGGYVPVQSSIPMGTAGPLPVNAALEGQMSAGISNLTLDATRRNVKYELGAKNSRQGTIDCSGWVYEQTSSLMNGINQAMGKEVFSPAAKKALKQGADNQGAAGIVQSVANYTGKLYQGEELDPSRIGGGMVIGIDTGKKSWDGGRFQGIDHIAQTYRDPTTGQLMVSESSSSRGVHSQTYESWYNYYVKKKGARIFGGNVAAMANQGALPQEGQGQTPTSPVPAESIPVAAQGSAPAVPAQTPVVQSAPIAQAQPVVAQPAVQQYSPEPVSNIAPPTIAGTNNQLSTGNIEKLLKDILFVLRAGFGHMPLGTAGIGGNGGGMGSSGQQVPNIQMDFDDPAAQGLATS